MPSGLQAAKQEKYLSRQISVHPPALFPRVEEDECCEMHDEHYEPVIDESGGQTHLWLCSKSPNVTYR